MFGPKAFVCGFLRRSVPTNFPSNSRRSFYKGQGIGLNVGEKAEGIREADCLGRVLLEMPNDAKNDLTDLKQFKTSPQNSFKAVYSSCRH